MSVYSKYHKKKNIMFIINLEIFQLLNLKSIILYIKINIILYHIFK